MQKSVITKIKVGEMKFRVPPPKKAQGQNRFRSSCNAVLSMALWPGPGAPREASASLGRCPIPARAPPLHITHSWPLLEHVGFSSGPWGAQGGAVLPGQPALFMAPGPAGRPGPSSP